jgi:DNA polymerase (family 10)
VDLEKLEIAWLFTEIADLLELKGDNPYRIRAYRRAARALKGFSGDIRQLWEQGKLATITGIGKDLAAKIGEILSTGTCRFLEELRQEVPPGLVDMLVLPEVGPRTVHTCYSQLGITTLAELEEAARKRQLRQLPGLGAKTELKILKGIHLLNSRQGRVPLGVALPLAEELYQDLASLGEVEALSFTGSLRRRRDEVGDVDILAAATEGEKVIDLFSHSPRIAQIVAKGTNRVVAKTRLGIEVDLWVVTPKQYAPALLWATGSRRHYQRLQERAAALGVELDGCQVHKSGRAIPVTEEEEVYQLLELQYIPPELREDNGEVEAAAAGNLPSLVTLGDIRGDLHCHTDWSDGIESIEEMAEAARQLGYSYLAITDHSHSLAVAGGLSPERLLEQAGQVREINRRLDNFQLLAGTEVDILADGSLDYPDSVLEQLDVVIASVHSHFRQDRETMTRRIIKAITNPHVDILAHPSGRILGRREPYAVDLEAVLAAAARSGTVLEINASPDRLDLTDTWARRAREMGVKLAVNTDAHAGERLREMAFGITAARRGWLEPQDLINTWPWERVRDYFQKG